MAEADPDALRDDRWARLAGLTPGGRAGTRGPRCDNRRFVDALLWMARSGARWRDLPERLGDYRAVKRRYYRWIERGVLDAFFAALGAEADLEWPVIDSTVVRAPARGRRPREQRGPQTQGLGRSRGGLSTEVHAAAAALGDPVRLLAGPGQENDMARAHALSYRPAEILTSLMLVAGPNPATP